MAEKVLSLRLAEEKLQSSHFDKEAVKINIDGLLNPTLAAKMEFECFLEFLNVPPESSILEVGGGGGRYTIPLLAKGHSVTVVDISRNSLDLLTEIYKKHKRGNWGKLEVYNSDLSEPISNKKFDTVICINLLHHVKNTKNTLLNMKLSTKTNGVIAAFEPNPYYLLWYFYFFVKRIWNIEKGILRCSPRSILKILKDIGLDDIQIRKYGFIPTRILNQYPHLLYISSLLLPKLPLLKIFSFHYMIKGIRY